MPSGLFPSSYDSYRLYLILSKYITKSIGDRTWDVQVHAWLVMACGIIPTMVKENRFPLMQQWCIMENENPTHRDSLLGLATEDGRRPAHLIVRSNLGSNPRKKRQFNNAHSCLSNIKSSRIWFLFSNFIIPCFLFQISFSFHELSYYKKESDKIHFHHIYSRVRTKRLAGPQNWSHSTKTWTWWINATFDPKAW